MTGWGMCLLSDDAAKSSVVLDRELEEDKSRDPAGPRIRCPLCGWSPREDDRWSCSCGHEWNTFDSGGSVPSVLASVGFDSVPLVQGLVAAFRVVCALTKRRRADGKVSIKGSKEVLNH